MNRRYDSILEFVYSRRWLVSALTAVSHLCVILTVAAYGYLLYYHFSVSAATGAFFVVATALPFFAVSLLRRIIDSPRPYELSGLFEIPPKGTRGRSFPSRHVYSAFSVAVPFCAVLPALGIPLLAISGLMAVSRVLLGIHFPRDAVGGAMMGVISGVGLVMTLLWLF